MSTLKKLMTLLAVEGLTEKRAEIIYDWTQGRTTSARELTPAEISEMCTVLQKDTLPKGTADSMDKKRKRVIAAIFGTFKKMNKSVSIDYVKGVACRAAKVDHFNKIPASRLDSIYNAFLNAEKDLDYANRIVSGFINEQICYN